MYHQLAEKLYLQELAGNVVTPSNKNSDGHVDLRTPTSASGIKSFKSYGGGAGQGRRKIEDAAEELRARFADF